MLYDFHRQQNSKKPGTIHATYLLSGTKKPEELEPVDGEIKKDGEDDYMQSSPFIESSIPPTEDHSEATSVFSITLAREEDLEAVRSQYKHISSIHVYSIGPHPLKVPLQFSAGGNTYLLFSGSANTLRHLSRNTRAGQG